MTASDRELMRPPTRAVRCRKGRAATLALVTAAAIVAISGIAFAAAGGHSHAASFSRHAASRRLCGGRYKLPKPIARQFTFHDSRSKGIRGLAFCGNGSFLAAADGNGRVYVWSMATHKLVETMRDPHSKGVSALAYRPHAATTTLAAADADGSVYLWRPGRAGPRRLADRGSRGIRALAFSPDGALLAVADGNGHAYIWSMRTYRVVAVLHDPGSKGVTAVAFRSDGKKVATGDANGWTFAWTLSRSVRARLQAGLHDSDSKGVRAVAFRAGTATIAIADGNGRDYLWVPGNRRPRILTDPASKGINAEAITPAGGFLAAADAIGRLYLWALPADMVVEFQPARRVRSLRSVAFSPDSRRASAGASDGTIYVTDTSSIGISVAFNAVAAAHPSG